MNAPAYKTRSELALAHLESLKRPLTDEESDQLRRALHAVYCRNIKHRAMELHRREERELLVKLEAEALQPDPGRYEH